MSDLHAVLPICVTDQRAQVEKLQHYFESDTWRTIIARQASVSDAEWPCHLCHAVRCPSTKGKAHQKWVQCDRCLMWQHYDCAGLNRKPRGHWFCSECKAS